MKSAGEQMSIFSLEGFHDPASRSVLPGNSEAMKMTVSSGLKCLELYKNSSPVGCLARMLLESSIWRSTKCFLTWRVSNMRLKHLLFQLVPSTPNTDEIEYLLWGTPNTMDSLPSRSYEAMKRQATNGGRKNRRRPGNLREQIDPLMCQAYVDARMEANGLWPTPNASDNRDRGNLSNPAIQRRVALGKQVNLSMCVSEQSGQLNPDWVTWLMGFPPGWLNLTYQESQEESKTE